MTKGRKFTSRFGVMTTQDKWAGRVYNLCKLANAETTCEDTSEYVTFITKYLNKTFWKNHRYDKEKLRHWEAYGILR